MVLKNITVDGAFAGDSTPGSNGDELSGVAYLNSSGIIDGVTVKNVSNSVGGGLFGLQHGSGILIDGTGSSTVDVIGSTINDFQKTGILVVDATTNLTANTITGIGATALIAQNGVQFGNAKGSIIGNTIYELGYSGGGTSSSGIIAYGLTGPLAIETNTIQGEGAAGSFTGIDLSDTGSNAVTFVANSVIDADYGIYAYTFTGGATGLALEPDIDISNSFNNIAVEAIHVAPEESYGAPFTTASVFTLTGSSSADYLAGSAGNDVLDGGAGNDTLVGNAGNDNLIGDDGNDMLTGGLGNDILNGGTGIDTATYVNSARGVVVNLALTAAQGTWEGRDTLISIENLMGSAFGDGLRGNAVANTLDGGLGNDNLFGFGGNDLLIGGEGNDRLDGGEGADTLRGGLGRDILIGGAGADTFVLDFFIGTPQPDTINDFVSGEDKIALSKSAFTAFAANPLGTLAPSSFFTGTKAQTADQHIIYNAATGVLFYDVDGVGGIAQIQVAILAAHPLLVASDLSLIG